LLLTSVALSYLSHATGRHWSNIISRDTFKLLQFHFSGIDLFITILILVILLWFNY